MRVLVNGLSIGSLSGRHVLYGHLHQLAGWTSTQHEYIVLTAPGETQPYELLMPNVQWRTASSWSSHWTTRQVWERWALPGLIREQRIDVYFTPNGTIQSGLPIPQVSLAQNPWPLVQSIHRTAGERFKARLQRAAFARAQIRAELMAFNSRHMQTLYRENAGGRPCRRDIIAYQGINDATHDHGAQTIDQPKEPLTILSVSAMAHWKGAEMLVQAFEQVRKQLPAVLRLVGPWPDAEYRQRVEREIETRRLSDAVTITGQVSNAELHQEYARAKVFCLMSQCESFGIPAVEAQIHGVPVVGSNICAMPEICGAGGIFHHPTDVPAIAGSLTQLLSDAAMWRQYSEHARANANNYRWEQCSRPLLEMFSLGSSESEA